MTSEGLPAAYYRLTTHGSFDYKGMVVHPKLRIEIEVVIYPKAKPRPRRIPKPNARPIRHKTPRPWYETVWGVTLITVGTIGTAVLVIDDITGIGAADDFLIPVTSSMVAAGLVIVNE